VQPRETLRLTGFPPGSPRSGYRHSIPPLADAGPPYTGELARPGLARVSPRRFLDRAGRLRLLLPQRNSRIDLGRAAGRYVADASATRPRNRAAAPNIAGSQALTLQGCAVQVFADGVLDYAPGVCCEVA